MPIESLNVVAKLFNTTNIINQQGDDSPSEPADPAAAGSEADAGRGPEQTACACSDAPIRFMNFDSDAAGSGSGDMSESEIAAAGREFDRLLESGRANGADVDPASGRDVEPAAWTHQDGPFQRADHNWGGEGRDDQLIDRIFGDSPRRGDEPGGGRHAGEGNRNNLFRNVNHGGGEDPGNEMSPRQLEQIGRKFDDIAGAGGARPVGDFGQDRNCDPLRGAADEAVDFLRNALANAGRLGDFTADFIEQALTRGDSVKLTVPEFTEALRQLNKHKELGGLTQPEFDEAVRQLTALRDESADPADAADAPDPVLDDEIYT